MASFNFLALGGQGLATMMSIPQYPQGTLRLGETAVPTRRILSHAPATIALHVFTFPPERDRCMTAFPLPYPSIRKQSPFPARSASNSLSTCFLHLNATILSLYIGIR